jgi:serine/threonine-protein kinase
MAGTISAAALEEEDHKTLFAQRELAREAAARQRLDQEAAARLKAEEEKRQAEEAAKDKERKHLEEIVAAQTKVLEEKLTQLASTMSPKAGATSGVDIEATHIQQPGAITAGSSLAGTAAQPFPQMGVVAAKKRSNVLPIVLVLLLVVVIGGGAGGYFFLKSRSAGAVGPTKPPTQEDSPIKPELLEIEGGNFQMGRNDGSPTESPAHQVTVNTFSMDKTEVTNAEYAQFVKQTNHAPPEQWGSVKAPVGQELLPVSNVSYDDAIAFAAWRSKRDGVTYRLPTEEEWEYAARNGDKDNLYPWGNTWATGRAATLDAGVGREQPVGTYPQGANRWGVQDLMGNVWEWTSSKASVYKGSTLQLPAQYQDWIVTRGGGYSTPTNKVSSTYRDWFAPNYKNQVLGFRLVKGSQ